MKPIKPFLISTKLFEDKNKYHISLVMHASLQVYYTDRYKTPDLQLVTTDWHRARNGVFTLIININIKQESRAAARKPRDAAAIPVGFHCHVVVFPFPVPMSTMSTFRPSPHRCVVFLVRTCCLICIKNGHRHSAASGFGQKANALSAMKRNAALNAVITLQRPAVIVFVFIDVQTSLYTSTVPTQTSQPTAVG